MAIKIIAPEPYQALEKLNGRVSLESSAEHGTYVKFFLHQTIMTLLRQKQVMKMGLRDIIDLG